MTTITTHNTRNTGRQQSSGFQIFIFQKIFTPLILVLVVLVDPECKSINLTLTFCGFFFGFEKHYRETTNTHTFRGQVDGGIQTPTQISWTGWRQDEDMSSTCASVRKGGNYRKKEKPSNLFISSSPSKCLGRGE